MIFVVYHYFLSGPYPRDYESSNALQRPVTADLGINSGFHQTSLGFPKRNSIVTIMSV